MSSPKKASSSSGRHDSRSSSFDRGDDTRDANSRKRKQQQNMNGPGNSQMMNKVFQVERILDRRVNREGRFEYKIKWFGYDSPKDNTWEDRDNVHCVEMLAEFDEQCNNGTLPVVENDEQQPFSPPLFEGSSMQGSAPSNGKKKPRRRVSRLTSNKKRTNNHSGTGGRTGGNGFRDAGLGGFIDDDQTRFDPKNRYHCEPLSNSPSPPPYAATLREGVLNLPTQGVKKVPAMQYSYGQLNPSNTTAFNQKDEDDRSTVVAESPSDGPPTVETIFGVARFEKAPGPHHLVALVRYNDSEIELVPTTVLAKHQPAKLISYYESRLRFH